MQMVKPSRGFNVQVLYDLPASVLPSLCVNQIIFTIIIQTPQDFRESSLQPLSMNQPHAAGPETAQWNNRDDLLLESKQRNKK